MPTRAKPRQLTLLHMILWVACAAVLCRNLQILADHQQDLTAIWENLIR